jgi:hypothetical protein
MSRKSALDAREKTRRMVLPENLEPLRQHLREAERWDSASVYFLLSGGRLVYIGKTNNLQKRISDHARVKQFDRVLYMAASRDQAETLEAVLISYFKPQLNRHPGIGISYMRERLETLGLSNEAVT